MAAAHAVNLNYNEYLNQGKAARDGKNMAFIYVIIFGETVA